MKRLLSLIILYSLGMMLYAQPLDAFKGVWPFFKPFLTQYVTYLLKYNDIIAP